MSPALQWLLWIIFFSNLAYLVIKFITARKAPPDTTASLHSVNFEVDGKEGQILTNDPEMLGLLIQNRIPVKYTKKEEGK